MVHQFTMQKDVICLTSAKSQRWYRMVSVFPYEGSIILAVWKFVCLMIQIGCMILLTKVKKEIMMV